MDEIAWGCVLFVGLATLLHIVGALLAIHRSRRSAQIPALAGVPLSALPPVTVLRPVRGREPFDELTLRTGFELAYGRYELILCCADADDPIVPVVRRLIDEYPHVDAKLLIGQDTLNSNPKLNNLIKGWRAARHAWVVMADSNVLMPPDYLQRLLAGWRADTGLICAPPIGCMPDGLWAEVECAFLNTYQARWQYAADSVGLGFAQGKTMLWRRADLERAGGIRALGAEIAEDAAATKVVRRLGKRVRLVDRAFGQPLGRRRCGHGRCAGRSCGARRSRCSSCPRCCREARCRSLLPPMRRKRSRCRASAWRWRWQWRGTAARRCWPAPPAGT